MKSATFQRHFQKPGDLSVGLRLLGLLILLIFAIVFQLYHSSHNSYRVIDSQEYEAHP